MRNDTFFKMPKRLFTDENFQFMSIEAKVLYGLMLDRMSLSRVNGWSDSNNRLYIIYSVKAIMSDLNCGKNKAIKILKELESVQLISRLKRRKNLTDLIYVNEFAEKSYNKVHEEQNDDCSASVNTEPEHEESLSSGGLENKPSGVSKINPNKTYFKKTEVFFKDRWIDRELVDAYKEKIKRQIGYARLILEYKHHRKMIDELVENLMEIYLAEGNRSTYIKIGKKTYPLYYVKYRYSLINADVAGYVLDCLIKNSRQIKNIKSYMLASLFNAPSTYDNYLQNEVNNVDIDMLKSAIVRVKGLWKERVLQC